MLNRLRDWRPSTWIAHRILRLLWPLLEAALEERQLWHTLHTGRPDRLHIAETAVLNNATLNTWSGHITVGEHVFTGYNVKLVAGTHDYRLTGRARLAAIPMDGCDIVIEDGAWLCENVVVTGPCWIGKHALVAAGAVVTRDVEPYAIIGGVPARQIGDTRECKTAGPHSLAS